MADRSALHTEFCDLVGIEHPILNVFKPAGEIVRDLVREAEQILAAR